MQLDIERQMLVKRDEIATEVIKKEQEKNALKFKEYDKQLSDQKLLIEEMKRKAEQGSMQMQGEVLELALEDILKSLYPFDTVEPVAKGVRGADVIHTIVNPLQQAPDPHDHHDRQHADAEVDPGLFGQALQLVPNRGLGRGHR